MNAPAAFDYKLVAFMAIVGVYAVYAAYKRLRKKGFLNKTEGLISLAIVVLLVFGFGWETAECILGREFGDPGDGSSPFTALCPFGK